MVPIAFTSDHIETLYELDIEYGPEGKEVSQHHFSAWIYATADMFCILHLQLGMKITRAPSLNDSPTFIRALADLASAHMTDYSKGAIGPTSVQMGLRCPGCTNERCKSSKEFFARGGRD